MAKVTLHPFIKEIRGTVGDQVFRRCGDRIIVAKKPKPSEREPSEAQLAHRERFGKAARYAGDVCKDPELRAPYDAAARKSGDPHVAGLMTGDYLNPPVVEAIDLSDYDGFPGDVIRIAATDDFEVAAVMVVLTRTDGEVIEAGEAEKLSGSTWAYVATERVPPQTAVRVLATAMDRPGGTGALETEWTV